MRVNIYAEEMTERVELVEKSGFVGVRFYLYLPVSQHRSAPGSHVDADVTQRAHREEVLQVRGPFIHHPGDDDSAAVTFWGKRDLRKALVKAIDLLDNHRSTP